ncbi:Fcf2-domain-containing protein [Xylariaceae sp. FL0594]|nr:Fcf2-domain-containing protein [Xylariaceae sp. FL0594]
MADIDMQLSDAQIDELLNQAESRLLAKQKAQQDKGSVASIPDKRDVAKTNAPAKTNDPTTSVPIASANKSGAELSVRVPQARKSKKEMAHKPDAGPQWFNLPATDLTPELRRDLQLLKMRDVLDPKRHYKKDNSRGIPQFSQVGTVIPGPTDFFSARVTKKDRKRTLLQDVLETEKETKRFKNKYGEIQAVKTSGKKAHYKKMMQKRYGKNYKG